MRQKLLYLFIFLLPFTLMAQDIDRIKVNGKVKAPVGEDIEGVSIYNISSQQGTITKENGTFELEVAENDRVAITALQFSTFTVIVDKGVIDSRNMGIYLNPVVNQLDEVIVRPYDLSGNIIADVGRVKTIEIESKLNLSYETLNFDYEFADDQYSAIRGNAAHDAFHNGQEQYGGDILGLVAGVFSLIVSKKEVKTTVKEQNDEIELVGRGLRQRFGNDFVISNFDIPAHLVNDFLYYVEENGMQREYLKGNNEIVLLDFVHQKSIEYNKQREEN
ncbi:peptidase associated/transthyretin-like domain-containing protein [Ulvibacter antarcticus]|uniref:Carboxypeptidase-like protein n=1 Tax=Ulvibacter antarcticus TaxID=442714 RepID=A0A3L9YE97_9FLAO|nr:hypothetical protein [Ulvibacter antarcticus]RMA57777.1 hypothetical protein BXY75_2582 [Ulvibacter antarcticus]